MTEKPKILIWDIETTDLELLVRTYALKNYTKYFHPDTVKRDWSILGASWKWQGEDKVHCMSVSPKDVYNDYEVVKTLHDVLNQAHILIGHNSDNFDLKKANTRFLKYNLPPLHIKTTQTVDTLKLARKYFSLTSNKLSFLAQYLGVESKDESPDWIKIMEGDADALRYMREYNKKDVIVTEQVYNKLKGWDLRHPDVAVIQPIREVDGTPLMSCKVCNSTRMAKNGVFYTNAGKKQKYLCMDCNNLRLQKIKNKFL